ncbi:dNA gyrase subunit A [Firmicutes bacterium CAG:582]|nr:dNA gyrase subunit A [Firmicutes bacterium CAG:582]
MDKINQNNIVTEVQESFLDYSMSVIVARALPDLRDGLKPVHRRILYSMYENGYTPDKQYRKCARVVGDVMGKYHPHGDSSIYEAMVRMAQDFSYRHMLIDGHGNFGNMDGDGAAAMRYTESRLAKISLELLRDLNKETVNMIPNFDETEVEPEVLPSRFPNILVNGTMGIAVGMATNIPPHNLGEVIDGCVAYIDNHEITIPEIMEKLKGPDFPTGGIILGNSGIKKAYETGRGSITIRCKAEIEEDNGKNKIVITELPYGINTFDLKTRIGELVRDKTLEGIADYHDATSLEKGVNIIITLKKEANPQVVLNNLYKHTQLQSTFGIIFLMIDNGTPKVLNIKDIISKYIDFQKEVIIRRTKFDLKKKEERVHILEGYKIALDNIDEVIKIIKEAETDVIARENLIQRFGFDEIQANAILELKLRRLTGLERDKIENELADLIEQIKELKEILASEQKVLDIIKKELLEIKAKYADERRTSIDMTAIDYIEDESLIPQEDIIVTISDKGYIKRCASSTFKSQHRGGVGIKGMTTNEEDYVKYLVNASTHDYILFFTDKGKVYRIKGYEIPEYSRQAKGLPIINLLQIEKGEKINSIISISNEHESEYLMFATKNGLVKKTPVGEYSNIRTSGKIAISLKDDDELIDVKVSDGNNKVILGSTSGRMVVFNENEIRPMGRTASGVKGINLDGGYSCTGMEVGKDDDNLLIVTKLGYGKKTLISEYRMTKRGSKGVKALNVTDKNGEMIAHKIVNNKKDLLMITESGMTIRMGIDQISQLGRVTQGVKLINLKDNQYVSTISILDKEETENEAVEAE